MMATIWRFRVPAAQVSAFERAYGANGKRDSLFRQTAGYIGTELIKKREELGVYLSIDSWSNEEAYFRAQCAADPARVDLEDECERMTVEEVWLGIFSIVNVSLEQALAT